MKTSSPTLLMLLVSTMASAQQPAQSSITVSLGGGRSLSSAALKQQSLIGDGVQAGADVFVPLLRKGWDGSVKGSGRFTLGILAGAYYQSAKNLPSDNSGLQSKYQLPTGNLEIMHTNGSSNSQAYAFSAGLQAEATFGRITLSPSVSGGYFTSTREANTQNTQVMVNGTTRNVVLSGSPKVKTQGLIIIPQLRVGYRVAGNLSIYAAGSMNAGPTSSNTQYELIPAGGFNDKNTYEASQLASGKLALDGSSKEAAYKTITIQAGFSWSFGKGKAASRIGKGAKGGGAASASYAAGRAVMPDTPRAGKQTQGTTFGEKVNQGLHAAGSAVAQGASLAMRPGSPIGGIVVKGGKNPGGNLMTITTDTKGQFEFTISEAGNYRFVLTVPDNTDPQGKSISEQGVKKSDNPLYTADGQSGNNPLHNAFVTNPGNPIGGIIVKGGKNPGPSMITLTTNSNSELNLNGLTAGSYRFTVTAP
ncbi:hypothetical protein [Paraflavitalea soli]|uniref:hypothetical protein n=1 Tax=Paraflavitalea soli TaxID=2315862 RepID=UPI001B87C12A|nr:hypothetical protein [Paraflavitalea soli]